MKLRFLIPLFLVMILGCQGLKERQLATYVGDKETKVFYKNTTELHNKIPLDRQVKFKSFDEAVNAGYTSSQETEGAATESE